MRPKPLTVFIEVNLEKDDEPTHWIPGYFSARFKDGRFRRVWWLCFAIGWVRMSHYDYNRYVESGKTEWRKTS